MWLTVLLAGVGVVHIGSQSAPSVARPSSTAGAEWRTWGGNLGNQRYAPLAQIDASNFGKLELAWRFKVDNLGPRPEYRLEGTPLVVDGVLYATGGTSRSIVALDAGTGELLWVHREAEGARADAAPRKLSGRGLAFWSTTGDREKRILYVTPGYQLVALDAATGMRVKTFGRDGIVDLKLENDQQIDPIGGDIGLHAAPLVVTTALRSTPIAPITCSSASEEGPMTNQTTVWLALLLLMATPAAAGPRVDVSVTPHVSIEPASVIVRVLVETNPDNRWLEVVAQSSDYFRSSQIPLDGARAPRLSRFDFRGLPTGRYEVTGTVVDLHGKRVSQGQMLIVAGAPRDRSE
jgi:hypothetical protein